MTTTEAATGPTESHPDSDVVTVVTGLPRSGTSLLMQMLHVGGFPVLRDEHRSPDAHNPRGYFEFDSVKNVRNDVSWLPEARNRAVKVVAPLAPHLRPTERYRFILIERNLDEVLASQRRMLGADAPSDPPGLAEALAKSVQAAITHITEALRSPLLRIRHADALQAPEKVAVEVADFVRASLDIAAMTGAVDPALHRERSFLE